ncbi:MAG: hypothetical protein R3288_12280 [Woeseiaceae bacterium]|nr:hypothetical protein [Woeseiaceae bacterium]
MADTDVLNADFARKYPDKFARLLGRGDGTEISQVLKKLPRPVAASVVARLPASRIDLLLGAGESDAAQWLADAQFNDAVALLSRIPRERSLVLVNSLKHRERRRRLLQYLKYPAHSVGALVTDAPVRIGSNDAVDDVLKELRTFDRDEPRPVVVAAPDGTYFGMLDPWRLLTGEAPHGTVADFVAKVPAIYPETSLAAAVKDPGWSDHSWLPVIDHERRILGGVSRSSVFTAATKIAHDARPGRDVLSVLVGDVVHLFGELLTRSLAKRGTR